MAYKVISLGSEPKRKTNELVAHNDTNGTDSDMYDELLKSFEEPSSSPSGYLSHFAQNAGQYAKDIPKAIASGVTSFLDVPSNLIKGASNIYNRAIIPPESLARHDKGLQAERERLTKVAESEANRPGPTFQRGLESLVGKENLAPQTEFGKNAKEFADTVGSVLFPLPGGGMGLKKALTGAGVGQAAKYLSKVFGHATEAQGEMIKTLGMLGFNLLGKDGLKAQASKMRDTIKEQLPKSHKFKVPNIASEIKDAQSNFVNIGAQPVKGIKDPNAVVSAKKTVDNLLSQLSTDIEHGISYPQLQSWKEGLSDQIQVFKKNGNKQAARYMTNVADAVKDSIANNPEIPAHLRKLYKESSGLFTHVKQFEKIKDFIMDHKGKAAGASVLALAGLGMFKPEKIFPAVASSLGALALGKGGHQVWGIFTKPGVAKALTRTFASASKENVAQFAKNVQVYNKEVEKEVAKLQKSGGTKKRYKVIALG